MVGSVAHRQLAVFVLGKIRFRPLELLEHGRWWIGGLRPKPDVAVLSRVGAPGPEGFERTLAQWRLANSRATLEFIDAALADALATYEERP